MHSFIEKKIIHYKESKKIYETIHLNLSEKSQKTENTQNRIAPTDFLDQFIPLSDIKKYTH